MTFPYHWLGRDAEDEFRAHEESEQARKEREAKCPQVDLSDPQAEIE